MRNEKLAIVPAIANKRLLLVEDEPTSRAILSAYLSAAGYDVDEAEDGHEAWQMLVADKQYELVITDRNMPRLDGLSLALRIKNEQELRHIPIIMQTSANAQEDIMQGIKAGVFYYLAKPYEEATLHVLVRAALNERERKMLFENRLMSQQHALRSFVEGEFHIQTLGEAQNVAFLLGSIFPQPELAVNGLYELLLNAIEHGNLGIGAQEKNRLLGSGQWEQEIEKRLKMPENATKIVRVQFRQDVSRREVIITDNGPGFDWQPYMEIEPSRATHGSGRGIAKANLLSFDHLQFEGKGNSVRVESLKK